MNKRYLEHADGMPFFWLGDTWWMGLVERLRWPEDFRELAADRAAKGFNVVQIVAGLYPDMAPLDPRGANEGGLFLGEGFRPYQPAVLRHGRFADRASGRCRVDALHLGLLGILPWRDGPGEDAASLTLSHRSLGRLPGRLVFGRGKAACLGICRSARMPSALNSSEGWTDMARDVRRTDPFHRLITVHPSRAGRDVVTDPSVLDFDMLQTGHSDYASIPRTVKEVTKARDREPLMPYINSEVCYEGILGRSRHDIQRFMFWASVLNLNYAQIHFASVAAFVAGWRSS